MRHHTCSPETHARKIFRALRQARYTGPNRGIHLSVSLANIRKGVGDHLTSPPPGFSAAQCEISSPVIGLNRRAVSLERESRTSTRGGPRQSQPNPCRPVSTEKHFLIDNGHRAQITFFRSGSFKVSVLEVSGARPSQDAHTLFCASRQPPVSANSDGANYVS
jgi:hypothetical protein